MVRLFPHSLARSASLQDSGDTELSLREYFYGEATGKRPKCAVSHIPGTQMLLGQGPNGAYQHADVVSPDAVHRLELPLSDSLNWSNIILDEGLQEFEERAGEYARDCFAKVEMPLEIF